VGANGRKNNAGAHRSGRNLKELAAIFHHNCHVITRLKSAEPE
jgi:hypothetical protein